MSACRTFHEHKVVLDRQAETLADSGIEEKPGLLPGYFPQ
jgi:hypothetical protein